MPARQKLRIGHLVQAVKGRVALLMLLALLSGMLHGLHHAADGAPGHFGQTAERFCPVEKLPLITAPAVAAPCTGERFAIESLRPVPFVALRAEVTAEPRAPPKA